MGWRDDPVVGGAKPKWADDPLVQTAPSAATSPPAPQPQPEPTMGQGVGQYLGGVAQGMYRIPQSAVELGARGLDATGLTEKAFPTVRSAFETGNRIANPQQNKYTKTGDVVGQMLGTAPLGALKAVQGAGYAPAILNAMGQGMGAAALTSSASDAPLAEQIGAGGLMGAAAGGAAHGAGKLIGNAFRGKVPAAPTGDELRTSAKAAYQQVDDAGVIISKDSWRKAVGEIKSSLAEEGIDQTIHPRALAAFKRLDDVGENITLKGAEQLRRVVGAAASSNEPAERRMAYIMRDKLDDYMESVSEADLLNGDAGKIGLLKEARSLWSKQAKSEYVESLVDRAKIRSSQFSGSGYENALRTEFRQLAMNEKRMRRFTPDERESIKKIVEGGPVANAMRFIGKFAPRGVVSTVLGHAAGNAVGGPAGGYAALAAGEAGRFGATKATERSALLAAELMRRGGTAPIPATNPKALALAEALRGIPFAPASATLATR